MASTNSAAAGVAELHSCHYAMRSSPLLRQRRLTGRSPTTLRWAVSAGTLSAAGRAELGGLLLRTSDVLEWHKSHRQYTRVRSKPWNTTADGLAVLGGATAEELAAYLDIHPGNARKHLLILQAQGRAERGADGQWSLLPSTAGAA